MENKCTECNKDLTNMFSQMDENENIICFDCVIVVDRRKNPKKWKFIDIITPIKLDHFTLSHKLCRLLNHYEQRYVRLGEERDPKACTCIADLQKLYDKANKQIEESGIFNELPPKDQ
jgi:hypothetical protein